MALNQPRAGLPYDFRAVAFGNAVWLYDNSSRTFCCSTQPAVWLEPLYWLDGECDDLLPECGYWGAADVERYESAPVPVADDDNWDDCDSDAWDAAREEAHANYPL
jgi:hypothetical protein